MTGHRDLRGFYFRWIRATFLGWLLGVALVIVMAMLWGLVAPEAQFMVGIGIGAGVGYAQSRVLRAWLASPNQWLLASVVGMSTLFAAYDLSRLIGAAIPFSPPLYALGGSIIMGLWQSALLRPISGKPNWWILGSVAAWAVPAIAMSLDRLHAAEGLAVLGNLSTIFLGGLMVGIPSASVLTRILGKTPS